MYTLRKKADKHQTDFVRSIGNLTNWLEGVIWWITYIILAAIFALCMVTIVIRNRIAEARSGELTSLFENTPLPIAYLDEGGHVKQVNQAFIDLFGYSQEELKHKHIDHFIIPDDYRYEAEKLNIESLTHQTVKEQTQRIDEEGNIIHVMINAFPILTKRKTTGSYYAIYQDISNIVEANEELRQIAKDKQTLLEEIHHRVKNNLAIISSLMFLKAETTENASIRDSLKEEQDRIKSMALIHEQLYQEAEDQAHIDMQQYLPTLIDNIKASHTETEATIETHVDADHIKIPLDRSVSVGLLVTELVNNAIKHAFSGRKQGTIYVSLQQKEDQLRLTVEDDGRGLPDDFQLDYGTMGMQLLQKLTKQLDGKINYDSGSGEGTTFIVSFEQRSLLRHNEC